MKMSANPFRDVGFQEEYFMVEYLSKLFNRTERDYVIIHSVCSDQQYKPFNNVLTWVESPMKNAQLGDIRIARKDMNGRPMRDYCVYIDVKYSRDWGYSSISFRKKTGNVKQDAISHICNFVGNGVANDFWYLSIGGAGRHMFALTDVQDFIRSSSEEKLAQICKSGKWDGEESWFLPLGDCSLESFELSTWIPEWLDQRIG